MADPPYFYLCFTFRQMHSIHTFEKIRTRCGCNVCSPLPFHSTHEGALISSCTGAMLSICDICRSFAFKLATMKSLSHLHINLRYLTSVNFQLNSFFYHQTSSKPHIFSLTHPFAALPAASSSLLTEARLAVMCLCVFVCNSPCMKMVLLPTFHCLSFHDNFFKPTPRYMFFLSYSFDIARQLCRMGVPRRFLCYTKL